MAFTRKDNMLHHEKSHVKPGGRIRKPNYPN
jgi:hypothetical protein